VSQLDAIGCLMALKCNWESVKTTLMKWW
jgi:hypothetical protein